MSYDDCPDITQDAPKERKCLYCYKFYSGPGFHNCPQAQTARSNMEDTVQNIHQLFEPKTSVNWDKNRTSRLDTMASTLRVVGQKTKER